MGDSGKGKVMIAETVLHTIINNLNDYGFLKISVGDSVVVVRSNSDRSKFLLSTQVYLGSDYIPASVRKYVAQHSEIYKFGLTTYLKIYENLFEIYLHYNGNMDTLSVNRLSRILDDFAVVAKEVRDILDENDRNDLIHVRNR